MKNKSNILFYLFLFTLLAMFTACEPVTSSKGVVKDVNGALLQDVTVVLEINTTDSTNVFEKKSEQKTKADGAFNFVAISPNAKQSRLTFQKEGYQNLVKELIPNKQNDVEVVLKSN